MMRATVQLALAIALCTAASTASARFVSVDPVKADPNTGTNFNRYYYANNNPYKFTDPDGRLAFLIPLIPPAIVAAGEAAVFVGTAIAAAWAGSEAINAYNESADTPASAGEKLKDGTTAAQGASGKKGELEGSGGQAGADGSFDSVDGTNERSPREGVRVKDLEGGGRIETHGATKNPDYPQGTPTVKVQGADGKPITTVRYPEPKPEPKK